MLASKIRVHKLRIVRRTLKIFGASVIATVTFLPVVATLLTAAVYFATSQVLNSRLDSIAYGAILTLVFWLLTAMIFFPRASSKGADRYSYQLLMYHLKRCEKRLSIDIKEPISEIEQSDIQLQNELSDIQLQSEFSNGVIAAWEEIYASYDAARQMLFTMPGGMAWVSGRGYVELSRLLHQADEAYIMVESVSEVITDGSLLKEDIVNSKISNPEQKLRSLESALDDLKQGFQKPDDKKVRADFSEESSDGLIETSKIDIAIRELSARAAIREASRSLHKFQDDQRGKQVDVRDQITRLTLLTGLAIYTLLAFALLSGVQLSVLIAATFFSLIGACTGVLSRLYQQVKVDRVIDNTRLAGVHLMAGLLLSGLAAIGGVAVVQKVAVTSSDFSFNLTPFNFLVAAAFGLAPNLFFSALQRQFDTIDKDKRA